MRQTRRECVKLGASDRSSGGRDRSRSGGDGGGIDDSRSGGDGGGIDDSRSGVGVLEGFSWEESERGVDALSTSSASLSTALTVVVQAAIAFTAPELVLTALFKVPHAFAVPAGGVPSAAVVRLDPVARAATPVVTDSIYIIGISYHFSIFLSILSMSLQAIH